MMSLSKIAPSAVPALMTPHLSSFDRRSTFRRGFETARNSGIDLFRSIIKALPLSGQAQALDIGCGRTAPGSTLGALAELIPRAVVGLERDPAKVDAPEALPRHVTVHTVDARLWQGGRFDLICVDLHTVQLYDTLALLLETVPDLLTPEGWVIARLPCRSRRNGRILRDIPASARRSVELFLAENFGTLEPEPAALLAPLERHGYEVAAMIPARFRRNWAARLSRALPRKWQARIDDTCDGYSLPGVRSLSARSWLVLRRNAMAGATAAPAGRATSSYRLPRGEAFRLRETVAWLARIAGEIGHFCHPGEYFARLQAGEQRGMSLLKHDIHHDLRRTVRMAAAEAEDGVFGVYFMMGPSHLNEAYFDLPYTWDAIRRIRDMGHAIGLHLDVMDTIVREGDLYRGIAGMLKKFAAEGITIDTANCHGNTGYSGANLTSYDFFRETCRADIARDHPTFGRFVGAYSFAEIEQRFGIRYWLDSQPNDAGRLIPGILYVTDNSSALVAHFPNRKLSSAKLDLDQAFQDEAAPLFAQRNTLVLLHPQFYE